MRRPSVLFLNRVYPPDRGATGRMLQDLARAFAEEGWQVTVITTGSANKRERDGNIRVIRLKAPLRPGLFGYGWAWVRMAWAALRHARANLVVTMSDPPMLVLLGRLLQRIKKTRHMHWCHDLYPDLFPALGYSAAGFMQAALKRLSRSAMQSADKVIVIGRCMAKHLTYAARGHEEEALSPRQVTVIPNWPDFELVYTPAQGSVSDSRAAVIPPIERFRSHEDQLKAGPRFRVLYAGNIGRAHPVDTILEAAALLHDEHPEIEFVFLGSGPRYEALAEERMKRGLDNIRLMPFQPLDKLREVMESGDVHLVSMKEEAAGMLVPSKLYAALASGRPCVFIGPAHSETAKVIGDFHAGVVTPQGDAAALAGHIKRLRLSGEDWFAAHNGALQAGAVFVPAESINAWVERAWAVVKDDLAADEFIQPSAARQDLSIGQAGE
jgi:colanic acid biosynthesis glycosyl transferase WcaI